MKNKIQITLNTEDLNTLKELTEKAARFSNNSPVSKSDVISGLLRFYKKAKAAEYHEEYNADIQVYIGNLVQ